MTRMHRKATVYAVLLMFAGYLLNPVVVSSADAQTATNVSNDIEKIEKALGDLLRLYENDEITPHQYHQRRSELVTLMNDIRTGEKSSGEIVELTLKNGDKLTGTVVSEDVRQIKFRSAWNVVLTVPVAEIENRRVVESAPSEIIDSLELPAPAQVEQPAGAAPETGEMQSTDSDAAVVSDVATAPKPSWKERLLKNLHGEIQVGADLGFGTRERQLYSANAKFNYNYGKSRTGLELDAAYGETDGVMSANRFRGTAKYEWDFKDKSRMYFYNAAGAGYDEVRKIDLFLEEGMGLGYKLIQRTNLIVNTEVGGQFQRYYYSDDSTKDNISVRVAQDLTWNITEKMVFTEKAQFTPNVDDPADFRARLVFNLSYPFFKRYTFNITLIDEYDSRPQKGVDSNDIQVRSSLGMKF
ncbi:MAG: DUF481 domain-containing protein [Verrucomicrobia bacterium]|nr:DUF481 domain-containing protein [Verrucomicrobiota bacterium]